MADEDRVDDQQDDRRNRQRGRDRYFADAIALGGRVQKERRCAVCHQSVDMGLKRQGFESSQRWKQKKLIAQRMDPESARITAKRGEAFRGSKANRPGQSR